MSGTADDIVVQQLSADSIDSELQLRKHLRSAFEVIDRMDIGFVKRETIDDMWSTARRRGKITDEDEEDIEYAEDLWQNQNARVVNCGEFVHAIFTSTAPGLMAWAVRLLEEVEGAAEQCEPYLWEMLEVNMAAAEKALEEKEEEGRVNDQKQGKKRVTWGDNSYREALSIREEDYTDYLSEEEEEENNINEEEESMAAEVAALAASMFEDDKESEDEDIVSSLLPRIPTGSTPPSSPPRSGSDNAAASWSPEQPLSPAGSVSNEERAARDELQQVVKNDEPAFERSCGFVACENRKTMWGHRIPVLKAESRFPSVLLSGVRLTQGKWYCEVTILRPGKCPQIGWADAHFRGNESNGIGAGDDASSWSCDGVRKKVWSAGQGRAFGVGWKGGDVIGMAIDVNNMTRPTKDKKAAQKAAKKSGQKAGAKAEQALKEDERVGSASCAFSVNGSWSAPMGTAFEEMQYRGWLRPVFTLGQHVELAPNFGSRKFNHAPPSADYLPVCTTEVSHEIFEMLWTRWQKHLKCMLLESGSERVGVYLRNMLVLVQLQCKRSAHAIASADAQALATKKKRDTGSKGRQSSAKERRGVKKELRQRKQELKTRVKEEQNRRKEGVKERQRQTKEWKKAHKANAKTLAKLEKQTEKQTMKKGAAKAKGEGGFVVDVLAENDHYHGTSGGRGEDNVASGVRYAPVHVRALINEALRLAEEEAQATKKGAEMGSGGESSAVLRRRQEQEAAERREEQLLLMDGQARARAAARARAEERASWALIARSMQALRLWAAPGSEPTEPRLRHGGLHGEGGGSGGRKGSKAKKRSTKLARAQQQEGLAHRQAQVGEPRLWVDWRVHCLEMVEVNGAEHTVRYLHKVLSAVRTEYWTSYRQYALVTGVVVGASTGSGSSGSGSSGSGGSGKSSSSALGGMALRKAKERVHALLRAELKTSNAGDAGLLGGSPRTKKAEANTKRKEGKKEAAEQARRAKEEMVEAAKRAKENAKKEARKRKEDEKEVKEREKEEGKEARRKEKEAKKKKKGEGHGALEQEEGEGGGQEQGDGEGGDQEPEDEADETADADPAETITETVHYGNGTVVQLSENASARGARSSDSSPTKSRRPTSGGASSGDGGASSGDGGASSGDGGATSSGDGGADGGAVVETWEGTENLLDELRRFVCGMVMEDEEGDDGAAAAAAAAASAVVHQRLEQQQGVERTVLVEGGAASVAGAVGGSSSPARRSPPPLTEREEETLLKQELEQWNTYNSGSPESSSGTITSSDGVAGSSSNGSSSSTSPSNGSRGGTTSSRRFSMEGQMEFQNANPLARPGQGGGGGGVGWTAGGVGSGQDSRQYQEVQEEGEGRQHGREQVEGGQEAEGKKVGGQERKKGRRRSSLLSGLRSSLGRLAGHQDPEILAKQKEQHRLLAVAQKQREEDKAGATGGSKGDGEGEAQCESPSSPPPDPDGVARKVKIRSVKGSSSEYERRVMGLVLAIQRGEQGAPLVAMRGWLHKRTGRALRRASMTGGGAGDSSNNGWKKRHFTLAGVYLMYSDGFGKASTGMYDLEGMTACAVVECGAEFNSSGGNEPTDSGTGRVLLLMLAHGARLELRAEGREVALLWQRQLVLLIEAR
jgi:hypothetical protein